jgi:long-chain acyl-CoA synthetase
MTISLTQCLCRALQQRPNQLATIFAGRRHTYLEFHQRVTKLAGGMRALGVGKGDRVGILALNSDRYLEVYMAAFWLGAAINPANTRWSASELVYSFNDCATTVLFIDDAHLSLIDTIRAESHTLRDIVYLGENQCPPHMVDYESLVKASAPVEDANAGDNDLAGVFYTGGTTGFPKGVKLSHTSIMGAVLNRLTLGVPVGPVFLHAAPLFHLAGALGMFSQFISGGTHVPLSSFKAEDFIETVEKERVTDSLLVPTMIQMVLDHPRRSQHDLSSLRCLIYGASPISETLLDRTMEAFPKMELIQGYGMTESSGCISYLEPYYHTKEARTQSRLLSAGRAVGLSEVKIVDHNRNEVARGVVGEIAIRGVSTMLGYWNKPGESEKALENGWLYSGDGAYMDDDGFIFIVDRIKDMIVSGGENVYCTEVENAILKHPAVASCAVIGIPSEKWGEAVHAVVVLKTDANVTQDELISHCKQLVANYKCPRSIEYRDQLPLSGAGKILKNKLRAPYWEGMERRVG